MNSVEDRPMVMHIINRLEYGGLENGLVNLVNNLPPERFRHHILSLTDIGTIAKRIHSPAVEISALGKQQGKDFGAYWRLYKKMRALRPTIVHTRNVGTLDCQFVSWLARVPRRIHGEHGWDINDPDGVNPKLRRRRKVFFRWVHRIVALSMELERYLAKLNPMYVNKTTRICNGVDLERFRSPAPTPIGRPLVFGSVTGFRKIKAPEVAIKAFSMVRERFDCRLIMVGDGPVFDETEALAEELGVADDIEFAGAQLDVAPWLEKMDVFVLSSLREGISNTVLEAMAAARPVVASNVGGNPELIVPGETGFLVEPGNAAALCEAMLKYASNPALATEHGSTGKSIAMRSYSLQGMVDTYADMYQQEVDAASE